MANLYATKNATATTTEASVDLKVDKIKFIANDDSTNDLYIALDESIANGEDYIIVKAGETFTNFDDLNCRTLYYKASAATVAFRFVGTREN